MNTLQVTDFGEARPVFPDLFQVKDPLFLELIPCIKKSFLTFRVRRTNHPVKRGEKYQT
jgi:hypothetical protein